MFARAQPLSLSFTYIILFRSFIYIYIYLSYIILSKKYARSRDAASAELQMESFGFTALLCSSRTQL